MPLDETIVACEKNSMSKTLHDTILTLVRGGVDLTPRQIHILFTLNGHAGVSLGELADRARVSRPLISRATERLVSGDYVARSRDAKDHRLVLASLTPNGRKFLSAMRDDATVRGFVDRLSNGDVDLTLRQLFTVSACAVEPRTVRWLAAEMRVVKPAVTRAVDRLEAEGYVERKEDGEDRRSVLVAAKPKGRRFVEGMMVS